MTASVPGRGGRRRTPRPGAAALFLSLALLPIGAAAPPPLALDHVWIVVSSGAPERASLEKAGFRIAPTVNRHAGQGTASVTLEFLDGYLELIYLDPAVAVSPGKEAAVEKFRSRAAWRQTGISPFGVGTHRTPATPAAFPFPTWKITADWMPKGASIEMLTPRDLAKAPSLFVTAESVDEAANARLASDSERGAMFRHPNGARRLTGVRIVVPAAVEMPPAARYLSDAGVAAFGEGPAWLLEVTLDGGKQGARRDLRPDLPLVVLY